MTSRGAFDCAIDYHIFVGCGVAPAVGGRGGRLQNRVGGSKLSAHAHTVFGAHAGITRTHTDPTGPAETGEVVT